eukprot:1025386-Rhodomonas_salina.2
MSAASQSARQPLHCSQGTAGRPARPPTPSSCPPRQRPAAAFRTARAPALARSLLPPPTPALLPPPPGSCLRPGPHTSAPDTHQSHRGRVQTLELHGAVQLVSIAQLQLRFDGDRTAVMLSRPGDTARVQASDGVDVHAVPPHARTDDRNQ